MAYFCLIKRLLVVPALLLLLTACGGGGGGGDNNSPPPPAAEYTIGAVAEPAGSGQVDGSGTYRDGSAFTLTASPEPGYVFYRWEENDEPVAGADGVQLSGTATGNRTFTAVFLPAHLELTPANHELRVGGQIRLIARLVAGSQQLVNVSEGAEWSVQDETVIAVDDTGLVTALGEGESLVTAAFGSRVASASVRVLPDLMTGLRFEPVEVTLTVGESYLPVLWADYDSGGSVQIAAGEVEEWLPSSPAMVSVAANGEITANAVGEAEVTARLAGQTATLRVTVEDATLTVLTVTASEPGPLELVVGQQVQLTATGTYTPDTTGPRDLTDRVTWQINAPYLSVSDNGLATAVQAGEVNVTATFEDVTSDPLAVQIEEDLLAPSALVLAVEKDVLRWGSGSAPVADLSAEIRDGSDELLTHEAQVVYTINSGPLTFDGGATEVTLTAGNGQSSLQATATGTGQASITARIPGTSLRVQKQVFVVSSLEEVIMPVRTSSTEDGGRLRISFGLANPSGLDIPVVELRVSAGGGEAVLTPDSEGLNRLPFAEVPAYGIVRQGLLFDQGATGVTATYTLKDPETGEILEIDL